MDENSEQLGSTIEIDISGIECESDCFGQSSIRTLENTQSHRRIDSANRRQRNGKCEEYSEPPSKVIELMDEIHERLTQILGLYGEIEILETTIERKNEEIVSLQRRLEEEYYMRRKLEDGYAMQGCFCGATACAVAK